MHEKNFKRKSTQLQLNCGPVDIRVRLNKRLNIELFFLKTTTQIYQTPNMYYVNLYLDVQRTSYHIALCCHLL